jgi:hypothetical protein
MKEKHLEDWYKESFEGLSETPPPDMWGGIAEGLQGTNSSKRKAGYWRTSGLLILLLVPAYFVYQAFDAPVEKDVATVASYSAMAQNAVKTNSFMPSTSLVVAGESNNEHQSIKESKATANTKVTTTKADNALTAKTVVKSSSKSTPANHKVVARKQRNANRKKQRTTTKVVSISHTTVGIAHNKKGNVLTMNAVPIRFPNVFTKSRETLAMRNIGDKDDYVSTSNDRVLPQGYYAGVTGSYSSLWGLNHDTFNGFDKDENVSNELDFGVDFGVYGGININDKWGIQSEFLFKKNQGQNFSEQIEGHTVNTTISLDYFQLNAQYVRKWAKVGKTNHARSINLLAGPYVGYLMNATRTRDDDSFEDGFAFMDFDFGIDLGLEYQYYCCKNWSISGGLETALGFVNVYAGDGKVPRDFNRTRNFSIGAKLGLTYHFQQTTKVK